MVWQLSVAKNKFCEVFQLACEEGPQEITRRNDKVFVISEKDYHRLNNMPDFKDFLLGPGPTLEEVDLRRSPSPMRIVQL